MTTKGETNDIYCDLCQSRLITKQAVEYCLRCEEALCADCIAHHKLSKVTKTHQTIPINEYKNFPIFIRQIKQYCGDHGDISEFHCPTHDVVCCKRCITSSHRECKDIIIIKDLLETSVLSTALDNLEQTLQDVGSNLEIVIADRQKNLVELKKQKNNISRIVKEKREEIMNFLDKLERKMLDKISVIESETRQQIEKLIEELSAKQLEVKTLRKDIELTKKYASSVQIFMGTRQLQEPVSSLEKCIQIAYDNGSFNQTVIEFKMDEQLNTITKDINEFGKISQKGVQTHVRLNWQQEKAAKILALKQRTIDDFVLMKVQQIDLSGQYIPGCTIMKDGNKLFTEYYSGQVLKYGSNGQLISKLKVKDTLVFDITAIDNSHVAVSCGDRGHTIHLIDVDCLQLTGSIDTSDRTYGITCHGGSLIYCTHSNGIRSFNMSTRKSIEIIPGSTGEFMYTYITSDNNYIYHSNYKTNSVVCYDFNGVKKWCYRNVLLKEPNGITVDSNSNIYVTGYKSNNVVALSPDGKRAKQLLGISDGINSPYAIWYDKDRNHLLVVNYGGSANLYEVS